MQLLTSKIWVDAHTGRCGGFVFVCLGFFFSYIRSIHTRIKNA